jgi:hypothetical protein
MKKLLLLFLILPLLVAASDGVFVLVDVSKSFPNNAIKLEAKNIVLEFLQGTYNVQRNMGTWRYAPGISDQKISSMISGSPIQILKNNDVLFIIPFGNKTTYCNYRWMRINNYPTDMIDFFNNNFPALNTDLLTFINIAQSMTVSLAPRFNLKEYYIIIMSDQLSDQTGSRSIFDQFEVDMMTSWNNRINSQCSNVLTLERNYFSGGTTYRYFISVVKVAVLADPKIKNIPDGLLPPAVQLDSSKVTGNSGSGNTEVKFTSYAGGKRNNPIEIKQEDLSITWSCENCPADVKYSIQVQGIDGNKYKDKRSLSSNSMSLHLKSGLYKIFVTGEAPTSNTSVGSDTTYIEISSGSAGWIIWVLLAAALGVGAILYLQKMRQNKMIKKSPEDQYS